MKVFEIVNKVCEKYFVNCEISVIPDDEKGRLIRADFTTSCKGIEEILLNGCESTNGTNVFWFADGLVIVP